MKPQATRTCAGFAVLLALSAPQARAEVEQIVPPGGKYIGALALPKLPPTVGWMLNPAASLLQRQRVMLPIGKTLDDTDAQITARAYPQAALGGIVTLDNFIAAAQNDDRQADNGRTVSEGPSLKDKAGRALRVFTFKNSDGSTGEAAYGSETSNGVAYWTLITLAAKNAVTLSNDAASFRDLVANYQ